MSGRSQSRFSNSAAQSAPPSVAGTLQRQCSCGQHATGGDCAGCARKRQTYLQRFTSNDSEPGAVGLAVNEGLDSPSVPLDAPTRAFMQPRFGFDFSGVQVHANDRSTQSARALNALAYTAGRHIVFDTSNYRPNTPLGRWTLAHELTHVVQQQNHSRPGSNVEKSSPYHPAEAEANQTARTILAGGASTAAASISTRVPEGLIQPLSTGETIGVVIGSVAAAGAIGGLIAYLVQRSRRLMHWETIAPDVALVDDPGAAVPPNSAALPQSTRLTILDEGVNRPFNQHNEQWVKVRVTVGPFLNREGWVHRNQLESRPETEEISPEQATEIFQAVAQAKIVTTEGQSPIPFHYPPDGCYARAHRMEQLITEMGYASEKVFALAGRKPLRAASQFADEPKAPQPIDPPEVVWAWHVAPIVKMRDPQRGLLEVVIDPSLYDRPILLTEWEGLMGDASTFTRLSLSQVREAVQNNRLGQYDRVAVTASRYTYYDSDLQRDENAEEAESEDVADRKRMAGYVHLVPVFEIAGLIRRELIQAMVHLAVILDAIRRATAYVRQQLRARFSRLLARLRQRLKPDEATQLDSTLNP